LRLLDGISIVSSEDRIILVLKREKSGDQTSSVVAVCSDFLRRSVEFPFSAIGDDRERPSSRNFFAVEMLMAARPPVTNAIFPPSLSMTHPCCPAL
jgi:hypothetical protein